jgi:ABC-type Mn2+/Zn2+ transport system permease subunit
VGFSYWGLPGALAGIVLSYLSAVPTTILISRRYDLLDARKELSVLPAILLGMLAGKLLTLAIGSLLP